MNRHRRALAPISDDAWAAIDDEAARTLRSMLAARRLVDFVGPLGWQTAAVPTGTTTPVACHVDGVGAAARGSIPLIELRTEAALDRAVLDAIDRGAPGPDLSPVVAAARRLADAEDRLVFEGDPAVGVVGLAAGSPHDPIPLGDAATTFPRQVARAVTVLKQAAVDGPYGVALGPRCYADVMQATEHGGYPVLEHVRLVTGGPVVWAPSVQGAVVLSMRGGDFRLTIGADAGMGYARHDATTVTVVLDESVTFVNTSPEAAVVLHHG